MLQLNAEKAEKIRKCINDRADAYGDLLVESFHYLALFAIGAMIFVAAIHMFISILSSGEVTIDDILLLFIYLELGAMVGIYFKTNHMPIRFLIYIAITALTRMLIGDIQHNHTPNPGILMVSGAILLLAVANLIVRYGSNRFPSPPIESKKVSTDASSDAKA